MARGLVTAGDWAAFLEKLARPALAGTPVLEPATGSEKAAFVAGFRDSLGHRRAVDGLILRHLMGMGGEVPEGEGGPGVDGALWRLVVAAGGGDGLAWRDAAGLIEPSGPLTAENVNIGIELWTQAELAALHAYSHLVRMSGDVGMRARLTDAVAWHLDGLQPDNATNHPWAVHVFVEAELSAAETGGPGDMGTAAAARMHAETLVHAARLNTGAVDAFSSCLLLDAARVLSASG